MCWGSFLNVVSFRVIQGVSIIFPRSFCPHCSYQIAWYDNIPVFSWLFLKAACRNCTVSISWLYPAIELFTTFIMALLFYSVPLHYFFAYFIFFSALIVTLRSDLETMLISRFVTLFLIPVALLCGACAVLPITLWESAIGALGGYGMLFGFAKFFTLTTRKEGIGQGDIELLALIGSFTGFLGCWFSLFFGSLVGTCLMVPYMLITKQPTGKRIPFGPFLVVGAIIFVLRQHEIILFFSSQ